MSLATLSPPSADRAAPPQPPWLQSDHAGPLTRTAPATAHETLLDFSAYSALVVEDDADFLRIASVMLHALGIVDLVAVENPTDALEVLGQRSFDLMLCDLRLGEESGLHLIEKVRGIAPRMHVLLMSASASSEDAEEAKALGAATLVRKPFSIESLELVLRRSIASSRGLWSEVHDLSLIDMLQMYHYGRRSVSLVLSGAHSGRIHFRGGQLVHAEAGEHRGMEALRRLLPAKTGVVRSEALAEGIPQTLSGAFDHVLLDALRLVDEAEDGIPALPDGPRAPLPEVRDLDNAFTTFETATASGDRVAKSLRNNGTPKGAFDMATEKQLNDALDKLQGEVGGFIGASIVDLETGMTLAARSARSEFDLNAASAYNSEMVKQKLKIIKALNLRTSLEDMLLTLGDQLHLIKLLTPGTFIYLAADRGNTNLAILRATVSRLSSEMV